MNAKKISKSPWLKLGSSGPFSYYWNGAGLVSMFRAMPVMFRTCNYAKAVESATRFSS